LLAIKIILFLGGLLLLLDVANRCRADYLVTYDRKFS